MTLPTNASTDVPPSLLEFQKNSVPMKFTNPLAREQKLADRISAVNKLNMKANIFTIVGIALLAIPVVGWAVGEALLRHSFHLKEKSKEFYRDEIKGKTVEKALEQIQRDLERDIIIEWNGTEYSDGHKLKEDLFNAKLDPDIVIELLTLLQQQILFPVQAALMNHVLPDANEKAPLSQADNDQFPMEAAQGSSSPRLFYDAMPDLESGRKKRLVLNTKENQCNIHVERRFGVGVIDKFANSTRVIFAYNTKVKVDLIKRIEEVSLQLTGIEPLTEPPLYYLKEADAQRALELSREIPPQTPVC